MYMVLDMQKFSHWLTDSLITTFVQSLAELPSI